MSDKEINIAVAFNDKFCMPASVMLHSLFKNSGERKISLFLMYNSLSKENRAKIQKQVTSYGGRYNDICIDLTTFKDASLANNPLYSVEIYYRILLPYITELDRILWLDADIIVNGDIAELYDIDLGADYMAACIDVGEKDGRRNEIKGILGIQDQTYFNTGVLLMDCAKIRNNISQDEFFNAIDKYSDHLVCPDQDVINHVLGNKTLIIDEKYNYQGHMTQRVEDTFITHFIYKKPWNIDYYGFCDDVFWKYAQDIGYLDEYKNYIKARKSIEKKNLRAERFAAIKRKIFKR
ncbi:MAG: glycosyltransferase family 8 protein [Clostridia bacterium]|nr:glycosyltransferase family 8 protein [Clostridia bacterium]